MFKNALVSVSDKTGLVDLIKPLADAGMRVVSTGGTARFLKENGIRVVDVSEQTGFPEVMDGRVKTLHPNIHMGLLARSFVSEDQETLRKFGIDAFDLVVGNLYPFEEALQKLGHSQSEEARRQIIEKIDVGGPSFLRAAAKSFERLTVVVDPKDYPQILEKRSTSLEERQRLAAKVFFHLSAYDSMIAHYLWGDVADSASENAIGGRKIQDLRYGENPHQKATWYRRTGAKNGWHQAKIIQGKTLSYNNLLDLDAAVETLSEFEGPAAVVVKHNNPCGVAISREGVDALSKALRADPVSAFGGILAINYELNENSVMEIGSLFLECIVAPRVSEGAKRALEAKKNLRVLEWPGLMKKQTEPEYRMIAGGFLTQDRDVTEGWSDKWKVIGEVPSEKVKQDLTLAWKTVAHLKSNAIAIVEGGQTLGLGMGQVNRVDSVRHSISHMTEFHPSFKNPVLASDAFFPFPDSIEEAARAGVRWVIQPGGSKNDSQVLEAAKKWGVNLIMTGERHFRH